MKKLALSISALTFVLCAFAEPVVYKTTISEDTTISSSDIGAFSSSTDLTLNITASTLNKKLFWNPTENISLNSLTINTTDARFYLQANKDITVNIVEDLILKSSKTSSAATFNGDTFCRISGDLAFDLIVGGSISITGDNAGSSFGHANYGSLKSLNVVGNISGKIGQLLVGSAVSEHKESNWANAAMKVGGIFASTIDCSTYSTGDKDNGHLYYQLGGIASSRKWTFAGRINSNTKNAYHHIMITGDENLNGGSAAMKGSVIAKIDTGNSGKNLPVVSLTMNSADSKFTQSFEGAENNIAGGIIMQSGTLLMNYGDTSEFSHGVLEFATLEGKTTKFGNAVPTSHTTPFLLDSIAMNANGQIHVSGVGYSNAFDVINATGGITGDKTLTISFDIAKDFIYDGEGTQENWYQIIMWEDGKGNTANVAAETATVVDNEQTYVFKYANLSDGLYVAYVAVPEPSTYAAIFGSLALGFAVYRRRK